MSNAASKLMWAGRATVFFVVLTLVVLGYAAKAYAAPGDLDSSFGSGGKVTTDFAANTDRGNGVAVQDDGKVVVAGHVFNGSNGNDFALARYNPNGTLDTTFGTGGKVITPIGASSISDYGHAVAIGPDDKIVVAGYTNGPTTNDFAVARYNPNGTLDTTFGTGGKVITPIGTSGDIAYAVAVQGTKTVVVGNSTSGAGTGIDFAVVRYSANGTLDSTFSGDGKTTTNFSPSASHAALSVAVQPDGKMVAAGYVYDGTDYDFALARYDSSGNLDTSFDMDGKVTTDFGGGDASANSVAIQEDGRIVAAGKAHNATTNDDFALARYNPNGSLNGEFNFNGKATTDFGGRSDSAKSVLIQDDGRIAAAGTSDGDFALTRYNADGTLNNLFSNDGRVQSDFGSQDEATGAALQTDGNIIVAGYTGSIKSDFALARYFAGSDDATPPKVSRPAHNFNSNTTLGTSTTSPSVPTRISWSATDAQGDVGSYQLQRSTNGGAYTNVSVGMPTSTTTTITEVLTPYKDTYRYRVRATDDNGNTSFWKYGPRFRVEDHQETSTSIAYSPTTAWTQELLSGSYGGQVQYATAAGSSSTLTFTGTNVAWVAPKSSNRGKAEVYLDGTKVQTVDLYSSTALSRQVIYSANGLDPAVSHKLEIKVLGTKSASSTGTRVDVDTFVVLR